MPFRKGDPRAKAAGRKGGKAKRGPSDSRPQPTEKPPEPQASTAPTPMERIRRNVEALALLAETFSNDAAMGVLAQISVDPNQPGELRVRAAQAWMRFSRGDPVDTTAIATAMLSLEGDTVSLEDLEALDAIDPEGAEEDG